MKLTTSKNQLLELINNVQHAVAARSTLPILSNVLISAQNGRITMTATDLDLRISGSIAAEIEKDGAVTLPAKKLASIIRELPSAEIRFEVDAKHRASIKSGPSFFRIIGLDESDFPPLPKATETKSYKVDCKSFKYSISKTAYASSTDETRYVLNGILALFSDDGLSTVATDGRRLAMVEPFAGFTATSQAIIPNKTLAEIMRILPDTGDSEVQVSQGQIQIECGDYQINSKLIEGSYPNYRQVIPSDKKTTVTFPRETLLETVRRVSLLSSEKSNQVKLHFQPNSVDVSATSPDVGEASETIIIQYYCEEMQIAFNPEYLMHPLKNIRTEEITLDLIDESSPGVIRSDAQFLYVIMPMRSSQ